MPVSPCLVGVLAAALLFRLAPDAAAQQFGDGVFVISEAAEVRDGEAVVGSLERNGFAKVAAIDGNRLRVASEGIVGWVDRRDVITAEEAVGHYTGLIERSPTAELHERRAVALWESRGDKSAALEDYYAALRLDPGYVKAHVGRGLLMLNLGYPALALTDLDEAVRLDPASAECLCGRGLVKMTAGDPAGASADYAEAIRRAPTSALAYVGRGLARMTAGDPGGAAEDIEEALRLDPSRSDALVLRAVIRSAARDFDAAAADYEEAIRLLPFNPGAFEGRGRLRLRAGDFAGARAAFDEALRVDPSFITSYHNRAYARLKLGDHDGALADLAEGLRRTPEVLAAQRSEFHAAQGYVLATSGRYEEASAEYQQASSLAPGASSARRGMAWLLATCPDGRFRDGKRAVELAEEACGLSRPYELWKSLKTLAAAHAEVGEFDRAVARIEEAIAAEKSSEFVAPDPPEEKPAMLAAFRRGEPWRDGPKP